MLQWTWEYRYFFNIVVSFPLDVYPELELLDYGKAIFNFSRNLHTVLSSNCTSLHPYQECRSVPFSPHPHQHFLSLIFLIMDILLITLYLLCFPYVQWCGALFHVPISHFYIFFGKCLFRSFPCKKCLCSHLKTAFLFVECYPVEPWSVAPCWLSKLGDLRSQPSGDSHKIRALGVCTSSFEEVDGALVLWLE